VAVFRADRVRVAVRVEGSVAKEAQKEVVKEEEVERGGHGAKRVAEIVEVDWEVAGKDLAGKGLAEEEEEALQEAAKLGVKRAESAGELAVED